nr:probable protein phosphatase 2C 75 isoform X1 [Ziziphus jujuba var. spinosa]
MTEFNRRMLEGDEEDSPAKCRQRRRRRIEMRRLAALSAASSPPSDSQGLRENSEESQSESEEKRIRTAERKYFSTSHISTSANGAEQSVEAPAREPVFGMMSVSGRSRDMEDAVTTRTWLCRPAICRRRPVHFFAVYDGHGGPHVAAMCRERMHVFVEEELMSVDCTWDVQSVDGGSGSSSTEGDELDEVEEERWRRVMKRSFERMDQVALSTCACGTMGCNCGRHPIEVALGGSTAVVAVLTPDHIVVANCGDSRAVLCRGGRALPLSNDHKPDRSDELKRIEAAGGRVIFLNGARVEGILAMSRAIGDKYLKPVVISEPDITFTKREPDDECLILASDGLWDVLSSDLACGVASECLREGNRSASAIDLNAGPQMEDEGAGALYPSRSALAAALLTRLALGRKSSDNVSVIVVDLKRS